MINPVTTGYTTCFVPPIILDVEDEVYGTKLELPRAPLRVSHRTERIYGHQLGTL